MFFFETCGFSGDKLPCFITPYSLVGIGQKFFFDPGISRVILSIDMYSMGDLQDPKIEVR